MPIDFDPERLLRSPLFVGACGSLIALRYAPGLTWWGRAFHVACGAAMAAFCAPAMVEWFGIKGQGMQSFCAFAVGLFGLSLAAAITAGVAKLDLADYVSGWLPKPPKQ